MALIECTIKREGGTTVQMGGEFYRFLPDGQGRHVCMVKNKQHIERLLEIPESYQDVTPKKPAAKNEQVETDGHPDPTDNSANPA